MTWGRTDDVFPDNPKFARLLDDALRARVMTLAESPIERMFLEALLSQPEQDDQVGVTDVLLFGDVNAAALEKLFSVQKTGAALRADDGWIVFVQPSLRRSKRSCRPDLVIANDGICIAVELDGHEFHERTKEQAQRDKARDRFLVAEGYCVLRFTGSEVNRDPAGCVAEMWSVGEAAWTAATDREGHGYYIRKALGEEHGSDALAVCLRDGLPPAANAYPRRP